MIPFLKHFVTAVRHFRQMGSLLPSSSYAGRAVARQLPAKTQSLVEYGPGTGNVTRILLSTVSASAKVTAVELSPQFIPILKSIPDARLSVINAGVLESLSEIRARYPEGVDAVVSGIPFSLIPSEDREKIVAETRGLLKPGGRLIAYQNSWHLISIFRRHFDQVSTYIEPRNIPPYFVIVGEVKV